VVIMIAGFFLGLVIALAGLIIVLIGFALQRQQARSTPSYTPPLGARAPSPYNQPSMTSAYPGGQTPSPAAGPLPASSSSLAYPTTPPAALSPMSASFVAPTPFCTRCGRPTSYVAQYNRYYCYGCRRYV
jgi:hypothetical protein